jgi:hypothetical protein
MKLSPYLEHSILSMRKKRDILDKRQARMFLTAVLKTRKVHEYFQLLDSNFIF